MYKIVFFIIISVALQEEINAQKYFTRGGEITFVSEAPLENIEAKNSKAMSVIDISTGKMEWGVLIRAFQFEKALMQVHFNENYMDSANHPKATFKGFITNIESVDFKTSGTYTADIEGIMNIKGEEKEMTASGVFEVSDEGISGITSFALSLSDFNIEIPGVVKDNIAKDVEVTIRANYEVME